MERDEYHILVEATDYGSPKRLSTVTSITVVVLTGTKHPSMLEQIYRASVQEDAPIGQVVVQSSNVCSCNSKDL